MSQSSTMEPNRASPIVVGCSSSSEDVSSEVDISPLNPEIGRYQLFYAVTETSSPGGTYNPKTVWKIDTVTGQVREYIAISGKTGLKEYFSPVDTAQP